MRYQTNMEGFEGQNIQVNLRFWSGPQLLVNGETAQKGDKRGEMLVHRNDGKQVTAAWKPQFLGLDIPQLTIDDFTIGKSLAMAFLFSGINPKNLALNISASVIIADAELANGQQALAMVIFILIASLSIAAPVLYYLIAGDSAEKTLNTWKSWLIANNATIMTVLFVIFGFMLLGDGLAILFG